MTGSHIDTQPTGGKFDGCYGVMAGLEVMRTLNQHGVTTEAPLELAIWTNEEGARFVPVMMGSGVFAGVFPEATALTATDNAGKSVAANSRRSAMRAPRRSATRLARTSRRISSKARSSRLRTRSSAW